MSEERLSESKLFWGDAFTTLVYGSAINLLLAVDTGVELADIKPKGTSSLLTLAMIIFLSSDWVSRILLPHKLPKDESSQKLPPTIVIKTMCEVSGLFFLTASFVYILQNGKVNDGLSFLVVSVLNMFHNAVGSQPSSITKLSPVVGSLDGFALFLLVTFLWNLILLKIMSNLSWRSSLLMSFKGDTLESNNVRTYSHKLLSTCDELKDNANQKCKQAASSGETWRVIAHTMSPHVFRSLCRVLFQLFANHMGWTCFIGAIMVFFSSVFDDYKINLMGDNILIRVNAFASNPLVVGLLILSSVLVWFSVMTIKDRQARIIPRVIVCMFWLIYSAGFLFWQQSLLVIGFVAICIVIPCAIFLLAEILNELGHKNGHRRVCIVGATTMMLSLFFTYLLLPGEILLLFIAIEQVVLTLFLFFAASPSEEMSSVQTIHAGTS